MNVKLREHGEKTEITVTKHQCNELFHGRLVTWSDDWYERLADITEHPVEYLRCLPQPIHWEYSSQAESGTVTVMG